MTNLNQLHALRDMMSDPERVVRCTWRLAEDAKGRCVTSNDPAAVRFCFLGGAVRIGGYEFVEALRPFLPADSFTEAFEDGEAVAIIDAAIAAQEASAEGPELSAPV